MNKSQLIFFLCFVLMAFSHVLQAQVFSNEMSSVDKVNVYKVVTFDEFMSRFNNDPKSNIRKAYKYYHVEFKVTRLTLIRSLFDDQTQSWDTTAINRFIKRVVDPAKSKLLNTGASLFAEATCLFRYNGAPLQISVILRYLSDPVGGSKWMICGVGANGLALNNLVVPEIKENNKRRKFINPVNNDINFTDLGKVFEDKTNITEYFEKDFFLKKRAVAFYNAIQQNNIEFLNVKDILYHDLQYDDWIFTVKEFRRQTLNSGWLINKLIAATSKDKEKYLKALMGE